MGDLEPAWEFKADDNVWAAEVSRDGKMVVLGSWDSNAYALDESGRQVWKHKTSDYVKGLAVSADGEIVVVGSYDRYIYAIKQSGKLSWRYKTENYVRATCVSADGEYVAAGSWRGTLYFLDKRGKLLWKHRIGSAVLDLAISDDGGTVVAGTEEGSVHAFDLAGTQKWTYKCEATISNVATSSTGHLTLVCAKNTVMTCLDSVGEVKWRFHVGGVSRGLRMVQGDGIAVVLTDNNFIQYVDPKGSLMFMRRLPEEFWEGSVAEDGISVLIATKDNKAQFFENTELASIVLESTQQTLEKVVGESIDITKAQEMHHQAGDLLADGQYGEAIKAALEAQALSLKMREDHLEETAKDLVDKVEVLVAENNHLDMRKAIRFLGKARRGMQEHRLERATFYARLGQEAAMKSIDNQVEAVDDELFQASLSEPIETDELEVDRALGHAPEEPPAAEMAPEAEAAPVEEVVEEEVEEAPSTAEEIYAGEVEEAIEAEMEAEEALEEAAAAAELHSEVELEEVAEAAEEEGAAPEAPSADEPCPVCGETAGLVEDRCKSCYSDEMMKVAVEQAKRAHKTGSDISSLAPDLKAVKMARQERDHDEVIAISERILEQLEEILGEGPDEGEEEEDESAGKLKKKRKKKKVVR